MGSTPTPRSRRRVLQAAYILISLGMGLLLAGGLLVSGQLSISAEPATESGPPGSSSATTAPSSATPRLPASAPQAEAAQAAAAGPQRTGRLCLMALGTNPHYRLREGGPVDLVIVSPEDKPQEVLDKARRDHPDT